jgi:hypothetical protein
MIDAHDLELDALSWSSDRNICAEAYSPTSCGLPVIDLEPGPENSDSQINSRVRFKNISLRSSKRPATFKVSQENASGPLSRDITVDRLTIECNPVSEPNHEDPRGIITLRCLSTQVINVRYRRFPQMRRQIGKSILH